MDLDVFINTISSAPVHDSRLNRYSFTYARNGSTAQIGFHCGVYPVRFKVPQNPEVTSANVRQFFENLLPEGSALDVAAATAKISSSVSQDSSPQCLDERLRGPYEYFLRVSRSSQFIRIAGFSPRRAQHRIRARPYDPFSIWDGSCAYPSLGFQDKVAVYSEGEQWFLVDGEQLASTHILKPEPVSSVLQVSLAASFSACGWPRQSAFGRLAGGIARSPGASLKVTRFDREPRLSASGGSTSLTRQALGVLGGSKYERPYGSGRDVKNIRDGGQPAATF